MREKIELTWQKGRGLWKKCVGKRVGTDGKPKPMIWWFTDHRATSEELAEMVLHAHREFIADAGLQHWTPEAIAQVQTAMKRMKDHFEVRVQIARCTLERFGTDPASSSRVRVAEPLAPAPLTTANGETVEEACTAYVQEMKERQAAGQISAGHVRSQEKRLSFAFKGFGVAKPIADLSEQDVASAVLRIASLPQKGRGNGHKRTQPKRISVTTAKNSLNTLRWFLVWADETDRWTAPRRLNKLFRQVRFKEAAAEDEAEVPHFDLEQLAALWANADGRVRTWIALGLNCAFGSMELATLKRSEIRLGAHPHIARHRQKSNVYAKWALWPETVELLKAHAEKVGELAFVSESGQPLVVEALDGRTDSINKPWARLAKRSGVNGTFKLLRKTAAWMTKQAADLETSEMMLSHTEGATTGAGKMNRHYAGRDWHRLSEALRVVRDQLLAAGVLNVDGGNRSTSLAPASEAA